MKTDHNEVGPISQWNTINTINLNSFHKTVLINIKLLLMKIFIGLHVTICVLLLFDFHELI